jgi:GYF domain 2
MPYHVSRQGQTYGPYTLEDLRRYVESGNVLLSDLARSDDAAEWVPVAQILGVAGTSVSTPPGAPPLTPYGAPVPAYGTPAIPYPDPPNLHWALVLVLTICTCGLFGAIWDLVQLLWMRRVDPLTKAMPYFIGYIVPTFLSGAFSAGVSAAALRGGHPHGSPVSNILSIVALVFIILYRFAMKNSLEQHFNGPEPLGLRLGPFMTFFFGGLYFQYHFNRINEIKQAARYRGF